MGQLENFFSPEKDTFVHNRYETLRDHEINVTHGNLYYIGVGKSCWHTFENVRNA